MSAVLEGKIDPPDASGATLDETDFQFLREFVYRHCGIALSEQKRQLVQGRLVRRLRALGLRGFGDYCDLLRREPAAELGELASVISTNVTAFFREVHHFEYLAGELLPRLIETRRRAGDRLRIWSAGCSSGEEPYSLAMVLAEALDRATHAVDAKILATDLSPAVLETARAGIYPLERLGGISPERQRRWFQRGEGDYAGLARVDARLREMVTVLPLNLLHEWPMQGPFDLILCRNVVIYFDQPTKRRLFGRFARLLPDGGHLFLGHSESMHGLSDEFQLIGRTIYQKKPA